MINEFTTWYCRLAAYQAQGLYPMNGPVEIRCCGLDRASDVKVASSGSPQLSAVRPRPDHPEWDTAVWLDVLTVPGTPDAFQFYRDMEQWMISNYTGSYAAVRPEWSKGWAYTSTSAVGRPDDPRHDDPELRPTRASPRGRNWATWATLDAYRPAPDLHERLHRHVLAVEVHLP